MNQSKFKPDSTVEYNTFEINKNNDEPTKPKNLIKCITNSHQFHQELL